MSPRRARRATRAAAAALCLAAGLAWAGPPVERYPAEPVDRDAELEDASTLWERAIEPLRAPQERLLREARRLIAARTTADFERAAAKASEAVALRPGDAVAHLVKATALEHLRRWPECAKAYGDAVELDPKLEADSDLLHGANPLLGLGICLARAGKLAAAEAALVRAVARAPDGAEEWLRLGETRVAMGKLREGLEALQTSAEAANTSSPPVFNRWLRVLAYDRGRQTALADELARSAVLMDRFLRPLTYPDVPFIHAGEQAYLLGIAWQAAGRPELALAYLRALALERPDDMWRHRVAEHIRLLEQTTFPEEVSRLGPAPLDLAVAKGRVQRAMPQLAACVGKVPTVAFDIKVTRSRPATSPGGTRVVAPPPLATATPAVVRGDPAPNDVAEAKRCVEAALLKLDLPAIKVPGTWYHLMFSLIAH
ncbi:MAG: hypothetical protein R3B48_19965 [Kofleriaceae bacterium]